MAENLAVNPGAVDQTPNFADVMKHVRETGAQRRTETIEQNREKRQALWNGAKEAGKNVIGFLKRANEVRHGLLDQNGRDVLGAFTRDKIDKANDSLQLKYVETRNKAFEKVDDVVSSAQKNLGEAGRAVNEKLVQPTVKGAVEVGTKVAKGVAEGALFTAKTVVSGIDAAGGAMVTGVDATARFLTETAPQKLDNAIERASNWKDKLVNHFRMKGEEVRREMAARRVEFGASFNDALLQPVDDWKKERKQNQAARNWEKTHKRYEIATKAQSAADMARSRADQRRSENMLSRERAMNIRVGNIK